MSAIADQFRSQGIDHRDVEFDIAISKYLNAGGTVAGALRRVEIASERMSGMGRSSNANDGHPWPAQTRQQVEGGGGPADRAVKGQMTAATPPSFNRGEDGHAKVAHSGHRSGAVLAREPTASQRSAALAAAKVASISVMDTLKIDGRSIGDWTVAEARTRGHDKTREGYILTAAARVVANAEPHALIRDVVKVREIQRIQQQAMEAADAV